MQQMNQVGQGLVDGQNGMSARSVSSTYGGMSPRPGTSMHRSVSTSALVLGGQASAFSSKPLTRMGGFRPISSGGVADDGGDMPISPHLFPTTTTPTMSEGTSPAFTYQFQPYIGHHRQISALSGTTVDTPALESSLPSPDFSTHHHSPLVTPLVGVTSAGLLPNNGQYFPTPNSNEYQFQQKLNGLAIQVDGRERMWDQGPLSSVTTISRPDTLHSNQGFSHEQTAVSNALTGLEDVRSPHTPIDGQMGQLQAAQAAAFQIYQSTGDFSAMPLQPYEMTPNPQLEVPSTAHSTRSDQQQWTAGEQVNYQLPLQLSAPPTSTRSMAQSQMRHVSSPYDIYPTGQQLQLQAPLPLPRSVSAGYVPVMSTGLGQESYVSTPSGPSHSREDGGFAVTASLEATIKGGSFGSAAAYQSTSRSSMGLMAAVLEGGDDRAAKRQRVKYPPVGKRLRPGPKPKPKTPKKQRELSGNRTVSNPELLPYDPFVEIARTGSADVAVQQPIQQFAVHIEPVQPTYIPEVREPVRRSETPADMTAVILPASNAEDSQAESQAADSQSNIPRSYLESCYIMFMQPDKENGGPVKRYRCNIDQCQRVFPRKSAIHSHIQTHLEDKPFVCTAPDWLVQAFVTMSDQAIADALHSVATPLLFVNMICDATSGFILEPSRSPALGKPVPRTILDPRYSCAD